MPFDFLLIFQLLYRKKNLKKMMDKLPFSLMKMWVASATEMIGLSEL